MNKQQVLDWFEYKEGDQAQVEACQAVRQKFVDCAITVSEQLPDGPDKDYVMRKIKDGLQAAIGGIVARWPKCT